MFAGFVVLCLAAALSGGGVSGVGVRAWYLSLNRPPATPPVVMFGPVWIALYLMMAVAGWLVWRHPDHRARRLALSFWGWQLLLCAAWAPLFFGLHLLLAAFCVCLALIGALATTALLFRPLSLTAAALLLPSLLWSGFAAYLTAGFWWLNG